MGAAVADVRAVDDAVPVAEPLDVPDDVGCDDAVPVALVEGVAVDVATDVAETVADPVAVGAALDEDEEVADAVAAAVAVPVHVADEDAVSLVIDVTVDDAVDVTVVIEDPLVEAVAVAVDDAVVLAVSVDADDAVPVAVPLTVPVALPDEVAVADELAIKHTLEAASHVGYSGQQSPLVMHCTHTLPLPQTDVFRPSVTTPAHSSTPLILSHAVAVRRRTTLTCAAARGDATAPLLYTLRAETASTDARDCAESPRARRRDASRHAEPEPAQLFTTKDVAAVLGSARELEQRSRSAHNRTARDIIYDTILESGKKMRRRLPWLMRDAGEQLVCVDGLVCAKRGRGVARGVKSVGLVATI